MKVGTDNVMIVLKGGNNSAKGETLTAHMSELQKLSHQLASVNSGGNSILNTQGCFAA